LVGVAVGNIPDTCVARKKNTRVLMIMIPVKQEKNTITAKLETLMYSLWFTSSVLKPL
jgi:hypothetical protein